MIGIVDYGMGNLLSVYSAFDYLGEDVKLCTEPSELETMDRIVIPGVGAFKDCISKLHDKGFVVVLQEQVIKKKKPVMGICLGMQIMANKSYEGGEHDGLGWFDAEVVRLTAYDNLRIPNIGWNEIKQKNKTPLFEGIPQNADFYLVHSYFMKCKYEEDVVASYDYREPITAAVMKDNIFAVQFHPEKSQDYGLAMLSNFVSWMP